MRLQSSYTLSRGRYIGPEVVGLSISEYGRFGNSLLQISNALSIASALRLRYVQLPPSEILHLSAPVESGDLVLLPSGQSTRSLGEFLKGNFYQRPRLERLGFDMAKRREVLKRYLVPHLPGLRSIPEQPGCLTIHVRSGDILGGKTHPDYVQPPLAFYRKVIGDADRSGEISHVRIVSEDRRNPCIGGIEECAKASDLEVSLQSDDLAQDLLVLLSARHLVFGYGTFGLGVCLLSDAVETLDVFGASGPAYLRFDHIPVLRLWEDGSGQYPRSGTWSASPRQIDLMTTLPDDAICRREQNDPIATGAACDWWIRPDTKL